MAGPRWTQPFDWFKSIVSVCSEPVVSKQCEEDIIYLGSLVLGWEHSRQWSRLWNENDTRRILDSSPLFTHHIQSITRPVNFISQEVLAFIPSSLSLMFPWQKTAQPWAQTLQNFTNWFLLLIYPYMIHNTLQWLPMSPQWFCFSFYESPLHTNPSNAPRPWRYSLNSWASITRSSIAFSPDFYHSFYFPAVFRLTLLW